VFQQKILAFMKSCFDECQKNSEGQKSGKMILLGLRAVGKTSLINRITKNQFIPNEKPTLGWQVTRSIIENFHFSLYDVGGQEFLRKSWFDTILHPNAIIFIIDISANKEDHEIAKYEFDRAMKYYFDKNSPEKLKPTTPILILGNKIDLNPKFTDKVLEDILRPKNYKINYRIGLISALKNIGIEDSLKWLVKEFIAST
jgi:small GTP-binding protein